MTAYATERQLSYLRSLMDTRDMEDGYRISLTDAIEHGITKADASAAIGWLTTAPRKARTVTTPNGEITEGVYRDETNVQTAIYKVQRAVHGSGNLYAKRLNMQFDTETGEALGGKFEYAPGALRTLRPEMRLTLEDAAEFGRLYGVCIVCGATLTDEASIERGIGPVCATRF